MTLRYWFERQDPMKVHSYTTALVALLLMPGLLFFSGVTEIANAADEWSAIDRLEQVEGIRVVPVMHASFTLEEMKKHDEQMTRLGHEPPASPPSPWLPVPHEHPVPPGARTHVESEGEPGLPGPPEIAGRDRAPALATSFEALGDNGLAIPPDTNGAVGRDHLVVPLNSEVRIQTKTGAVLSTVGLRTFWSPLGVVDTFDPKIIYDPDSERFLFVTCAERSSAASSMLLGVSVDSDPTGLWYMWKLDGDATDTNWVDYPNIGVNGKWITFTANMYAIADDAFAGANIWAIDKASALDGGDFTGTLFFLTDVSGTLAPCLTYSSVEPTQYLINEWSSSWEESGYLRLYNITGPAEAPIWTTTSLYPSASDWDHLFPDAPQLGSSHPIETNDPRMMNAVLRNGSLWCTHAVALPAGAPDRTAVKWWQIDPTDGSTIQSGVVDDTVSDMYYYFPSIAVNQYDEVLLGFSGSSTTTYAGSYYTYRDPTTPPGTMESVSLMKAGEASYYKTFWQERNRWGDYSATCVDPVNDSTLWTIQEYADLPKNRWGTWWGKLASRYRFGDLAPYGRGDGQWSAADINLSVDSIRSALEITGDESDLLDVAPVRVCPGPAVSIRVVPEPDGNLDASDLSVLQQAAAGYVEIVPECP